uniref:Gingipain domain-containing protein n=1 Tax=Candidatus Methanophaga sp. ANME-1 ERB7 TaxID=2759913 RepID=A0A7G9Z6R9_9EURY|nr:hypothetical protein AGOHDPGA_00010 [Methanosarcinales archaeon ANME-1 ERB7]
MTQMLQKSAHKKPFFKRSVFRNRFSKGTITLILILCVALVVVQTVTAASNGGDTDVILVGTRNWQDVIAATPLAISQAENASRPLLLVPTGVETGERYSWLENADLVKYGVPPIINKLTSGNVSTVIINLKDDNGFVYFPSEVAEEDAIGQDINVTKVFIDKAHEEGLRVFAALSCFCDPITVGNHPEWGQVDNEDKRSKEWVCPLNDEYKEYLLNLTAEVLGYDIDGVVLSDFGYAGCDYCFCDRCKRGFWNDTGIDPGKVDLANRYSSNTQKWFDWRASKVTEFLVSFCKQVKKIEPEITIGAKMQNPFDDYYPAGYDREAIASLVELMLIDPIGTRDIRILSQDIGKEAAIYIFWRKSDIEDTMSVPNVEGTIINMEDAKAAGATGVVLDYDIAYTPIWLELKTRLHSTSWFLSQYLPEHVTIIGDSDVTLPGDLEVSRICGTDIFDTAARIASYQNQSQGVVILNSTDYHSAVEAAPLASYLGYPLLYVGEVIPNSTGDALNILDTNEVIVIGAVSLDVIQDLEAMNISVSQGDANEMLIREMAKNGEEVNAVVFTNTRDIELTSPKPKTIKFEKEIGDILVSTELFPAEVPCDQEGTTYYITVNVKNTGDDVVEDITIQDMALYRRIMESAIATAGNVSIQEKREITWEIGDLYPDKVVTLSIEGALDFAMDAGEEKSIDEGIIINFDGIEKFLPDEEIKIIAEPPYCDYIRDISYPINAKAGTTALIIWDVTLNTSGTYVEYYPPHSGSECTEQLEGGPGRCKAEINLTKSGTWEFEIHCCNGSDCCYTPTYEINVTTIFPSINTTAFAYTKIPKLSLTAAQIAAARKAPVIDINKNPEEIIPMDAEETLKESVLDYKIEPDYLIVVGGTGSVPFVDTGQVCNLSVTYDNYRLVDDYLPQYFIDALNDPKAQEKLAAIAQEGYLNSPNNPILTVMEFDIYRDYNIQLDDDDFREVATGRIIGLDVYDASAVMARTLAYKKIAEKGDWKSKALVITNSPLASPQTPTAGDINKYLEDAGLSVDFEAYEKANCPEVMMEMNNGKNIVFFLHHGSESVWGLNEWAWLEPYLDATDVKLLRLAPQTTHAYTCLSGRLKGGRYYDELSNELFYEPLDLDSSIAMSFLEAGSVNYISANSLSWIFITEDFSKAFYQSLIYGNMSVGEALTHAKNLYLLKLGYSEDMLSEYPGWEEEITGMINETAEQFILLGDPMFKPLLPKIPEKPIDEAIISRDCGNDNEYVVTMAITPLDESATKWTYWYEQPVVAGKVNERALPSLVGELELPIEAEDVVVRGMNGIVWHGEDITENKKVVLFPVMDPMPKLNEAREFKISYVFVPKLCWELNLTAGWSMFSSPVALYESDVEQVLDDVPYSAVFYFDPATMSWLYYLKNNTEASTLTAIEPGKAYWIETEEQASLNLSGRAVEMPFELCLSKGWNMIGLPSTEEVKIAALNVTVDYEEYTFDEAVQNRFVSAFIFMYEDGEWEYLDSSETLKPGVGYYFEVYEDCNVVVPEVQEKTIIGRR